MSELYFSIDIEADGPIPGRNSMLSFGCAVFTGEGKMIETYTANLDTLPDATTDPNTMEWWNGQPEAWTACRKDTRPAEVVMPEFVQWVKRASGPSSAVFVGYPSGYDFTFMYYYMIAFAGESPFSFSALDIKTMAMVVLGTEFRKTTKKAFPKSWFGKSRHSHIALDDAIEQGELFCNILAETRKQLKPQPFAERGYAPKGFGK